MIFVKNLAKSAFLLAAVFSLQAGVAAASPDSAADNEFSADVPLNNDDLDKSRGEGTNIFNLSNLSAELTGNTATNTVSGDNTISADALSGFNGFANVIQNSGNNVIVQQDTTINVNINP